MDNQERIHQVIFSKSDEITWQTIIYELVKSNQMDPWDIDISMLTQKYIDMLKNLKEHDFRVSGKVLLAAAILLKMKSNKLVGDDLNELDRLLVGVEEEMEELDIEDHSHIEKLDEIPTLIPRTPQPRKRKVSIFDLVNALERALEVKKRRVWQSIPPLDVHAPKKKKDITVIIKEVYGRIRLFFVNAVRGNLTFTKLLPSQSKEDKINTFVPLLHLAQQNKIDLEQDTTFGEIRILMKKKEEEKKEQTQGA